jgi:hypothetical protein
MKMILLRASSILFLTILVSDGTNAQDTLLLATWGRPSSPRFLIEVRGSGTLLVTKESSPITKSGLTKKTVEKKIGPEAAGRILKLAKEANDFADGCKTVTDGTSADLLLLIEGKVTHRRCDMAKVWPKGQKTSLLVREINRSLSKEMQVY